MTARRRARVGSESVERVGKTGQISLGKQHAGQYFRVKHRSDGSIVLVPVVVVARSHWTVRDEKKIQSALAWAAEHPPAELDLESLVVKAEKRVEGNKRGR